MSQEPGTNGRTEQAFSQAERDAVYRAIFERRDVRSQFRADPLPEEVLLRLLTAAHHAPSVGFMQPWDFIVIDDPELKRAVRALYEEANERAARHYDGDRGTLYRQLKLEGILDSPINLVVTCDRARGGPHVLGRDSSIDMDLFSTCLAVQNLWLAARAEGVGVGWVSILDERALARLLNLPESVFPVAYLCLGYVTEFLPEPELQAKGWRQRLPLASLLHANSWMTALSRTNRPLASTSF